MTSTEQNKSNGKSGRRSRKGERTKKADAQSAIEVQPIEKVLSAALNSDPEQPSHPDLVEPIEAVVSLPAPADLAPVSLQTIANAYRDYTRKSFAEVGSYFEQLAGVRSLDKAMAVQNEFMKRAYETTVAETQKICELHSQLAKQTLQPFQRVVDKQADTRGRS